MPVFFPAAVSGFSALHSGVSRSVYASATFTATEEENADYSPVKREVEFDGGVASLRELSETSPVFTSKSSAKQAYEISADLINPEASSEEGVEAIQEVDDGVDYVTVDESAFEDVDSPDFDEWTKVFAEQVKQDDEPTEERFSDYFENVSVEGASADDEEYSDDEEEEEDAEDEYEEEETDEYYDDEDEEEGEADEEE